MLPTPPRPLAWSLEYTYNVVVDVVKLDQPQCRTAEECTRQILEEYKREVERLRTPPPPPPPDPAEELVREYPELSAFGVEWVRKWLDLRERLIEIASVLRRFPWMVDAIKQRQMSILHPYMIKVYIAKDGSEACPSLNPPKAYCARNEAEKEVKLELEFKRYETHEDKTREPQGTVGVYHGGEGVREDTLTAFPPLFTSKSTS